MIVSRILPAIAVLMLIVSGPARGADDYAFYHENVLGTSLELGLRADDELAARRAESRVLAEIERLRAIFSTYDPSSELSRLQAAPVGTSVEVSPELALVLADSDHWRRATSGAFDPRAEALVRLWREATAQGRAPSDRELGTILSHMAPDAWRVDPSRQHIERLSACPVTLDAIAKGFIVERACAATSGPGVRGVLVNLGGDLRAAGEPARSIAIAPPRGDSDSAGVVPLAVVEVRDRSVATSGDSRRGLRIGDRWYSHIIDPRTGRPAEAVIQATVIALDGADADALATAFNVMAVEDSLRLADSLPGIACLIVSRDGTIARSRRWSEFDRPATGPAEGGGDDAPAAAKGWGEQFELAINFEINRPPDATKGYRRPYVVIWAEDESGATVRTLVYWVSLGGQGPDRWLPDLSRWYRDDPGKSLVEKKNMVFTTARPTRPPGKYNYIWDGKDEKGRPLPAGKYTLSIEAARENGTHQLMRKALTLGDEPFVEELKGDVEIKSASLTYRRKPQAK
jgi:thiamine biosynthesis lipoprotein ApbE